MSELLRYVWEIFSGLPRDVFGDRVESGWGIAATIYVTVVAIAFAIGGYRSVHELVKAMDIRFKKEKLEAYNQTLPPGASPREIDWVRARTQQVRSLRFTVPFGLVVMAVLYLWVRDSFTLAGYFKLAAVWLIFSILILRIWWIATAVWTQRKLVKKGEIPARNSKLHDVSVWWALRHYLNWGLQKVNKKAAAIHWDTAYSQSACQALRASLAAASPDTTAFRMHVLCVLLAPYGGYRGVLPEPGVRKAHTDTQA